MLAPRTLNAMDAAHYCGISRAQLYKLRSAGRFPEPSFAVPMTKTQRRWRVEQLDRWLDENTTAESAA